MQQFKIRSSKAIEILGDVNKPTAKQLQTIDELSNKDKLTDNQRVTLNELIAKRDAKPELSVGAKTHCKSWLKKQLEIYGRTRDFSNKYTEKGILAEPEAIQIVAKRQGYGTVSKNELSFENEYITGTPDLITTDWVDDIKNSWDTDTFPLFEPQLPDKDKKYEWQIRCYMELTGKGNGAINYCLIDAPEGLIAQQARKQSYLAGYEEENYEIYAECKQKLTYDDIPMDLRHRRYEFKHDPAAIRQLIEQVKLCRIYINNVLIPMVKTFRNIDYHELKKLQQSEITPEDIAAFNDAAGMIRK